jgi:hypothetical protein
MAVENVAGEISQSGHSPLTLTFNAPVAIVNVTSSSWQ